MEKEVEDFVSRLEQIATQYVFDHSQLVIEITENIMKHDEIQNLLGQE